MRFPVKNWYRNQSVRSPYLSMVTHPYMATYCCHRRNRRNRSAFSKVVETRAFYATFRRRVAWKHPFLLVQPAYCRAEANYPHPLRVHHCRLGHRARGCNPRPGRQGRRACVRAAQFIRELASRCARVADFRWQAPVCLCRKRRRAMRTTSRFSATVFLRGRLWRGLAIQCRQRQSSPDA